MGLIYNQEDIGHDRPLFPHEVEQTLCELGRYWQIRESKQGDVHVGRYKP